jgi:DNA-directed RNA polymerase subunit L
MRKLSDSVIRKYEDVIDVDDWEIETPSGWQSVSRVMKTIPFEKWTVSFSDGSDLEGADTHIVINSKNEEVFLKDLQVGDAILSRDGIVNVVAVENNSINENMYDLEIDSEDHTFYSNNVVSHNSVTVAAYLLHQAVFQEEFRIAVLSNKAASSKSILSKIKRMFEELPHFLKPGVEEWNKESILLSNGNLLQSASTNSSSIRGESLNIVYLDEFAHVQNGEEFFASTYPVITSGETTKVIITSTPKGMNLFYKLWAEAERKLNHFVPVKFLWYDHPKRDAKWKEETLKNISEERFSQEFDCVDYFSKITISDGATELTLPIGEFYDLSGETKYNDADSIEELCLNKQGVIYRIERSDGLAYVGITVDLEKRLTQHSRSRRFVDYKIQEVEVLFSGDYLECAQREQEYIEKYDTYKNGLNMAPAGKVCSKQIRNIITGNVLDD